MRRFKEAIKQDIIGFLLFCFLVGAGFIWLGSAYKWIHLSDGDRVNGTVLWLTSLAIFWYAYETYQLKKSNSDQVNLQEEIMLNEFLPILEPVATGRGAVLRAGKVHNLQIKNLGRGPAKYIFLEVGRVKVDLNWSLAASQTEVVRVPAEEARAIKQTLADAPHTVRLKIVYQDIYKRHFQTDQVIFNKLSGRTGYGLRQGSWDFKRLRKPDGR